MSDEIAVELAKLEREALRRIEERVASEQLGELFTGLDDASDLP